MTSVREGLALRSPCERMSGGGRPPTELLGPTVGEGSERSAAAACYGRRKITGGEGAASVVSKQTGRKRLRIVLVLMGQQWRAGGEKSSADSCKQRDRYNNTEGISERGRRVAPLWRTGVSIESAGV